MFSHGRDVGWCSACGFMDQISISTLDVWMYLLFFFKVSLPRIILQILEEAMRNVRPIIVSWCWSKIYAFQGNVGYIICAPIMLDDWEVSLQINPSCTDGLPLRAARYFRYWSSILVPPGVARKVTLTFPLVMLHRSTSVGMRDCLTEFPFWLLSGSHQTWGNCITALNWKIKFFICTWDLISCDFFFFWTWN